MTTPYRITPEPPTPPSVPDPSLAPELIEFLAWTGAAAVSLGILAGRREYVGAALWVVVLAVRSVCWMFRVLTIDQAARGGASRFFAGLVVFRWALLVPDVLLAAAGVMVTNEGAWHGHYIVLINMMVPMSLGLAASIRDDARRHEHP